MSDGLFGNSVNPSISQLITSCNLDNLDNEEASIIYLHTFQIVSIRGRFD